MVCDRGGEQAQSWDERARPAMITRVVRSEETGPAGRTHRYARVAQREILQWKRAARTPRSGVVVIDSRTIRRTARDPARTRRLPRSSPPTTVSRALSARMVGQTRHRVPGHHMIPASRRLSDLLRDPRATAASAPRRSSCCRAGRHLRQGARQARRFRTVHHQAVSREPAGAIQQRPVSKWNSGRRRTTAGPALAGTQITRWPAS